MKRFSFAVLCGLLAFAAFYSCDDDIIGNSLQPDQDKISAYYDTFSVSTKTVLVDSLYSRSSSAYLGEFTDPFFGTTKSDFLAQFYCPRSFQFPDDVTKIDSAYLYLYYTKWFGDSTASMHTKVYEMNKPLDASQYYTNIDPSKYYSESKLIGQRAYTAGDMYSSDSVRALSSYETVLRIPVSLSLGNRFLSDSRAHPEYFKTPEQFMKYFNGLYVTTDFGNGNIMYVTHSELEFCYGTYLYSKASGGLRDSFVIGASYFPVTKEVKQVNRFLHRDLLKYLNPENNSDSLNYVFAPAGLYTRISIPESMFTKLANASINSMHLKIRATQLDESEYGMSEPGEMMLINESDAQTFFSKFELNDNLNSFIAAYDSTNACYDFDISYYGQKMIRELKKSGSTTLHPYYNMLLIPVSVVTSSDGDKVRLEQLLTPSAVKVKGGKHPYQPMKLEVVYSRGKFN